jgi:hypothetical protein
VDPHPESDLQVVLVRASEENGEGVKETVSISFGVEVGYLATLSIVEGRREGGKESFQVLILEFLVDWVQPYLIVCSG